MFEIYARRLVNRNNSVPPSDSPEAYEALVWSGVGGTLNLVMPLKVTPPTMEVRIAEANEDGAVYVEMAHFLDGFAALRRVTLPQELGGEGEQQQERWASVIERACQALELGDNVDRALATELRVAGLDLMERASRAKDELESTV